ncbi:proton extrusion protein PcxA [Oscillatoria salina]|uniref:proton extrusion protein PcxA n=1 Tax=Oscillatoria salina TaxID=331517 RepID=UPI0013B9F36C|nr:proton extrusion protein PcxA [Oscillatoria salina]MBZ8181266.1 proton extrusion protein PcxA [Oscillatoria salina IIICB1]NET90404.1 proton extrusion protein PcxA [Kamptonema sp. SIO1D9]
MKLKSVIRNARKWFEDTPERALDQAYRAVLMIKAIEEEHFHGHHVSAEYCDYRESAILDLQAEVQKCLKQAKIRLTEFKISRSFFRLSETQNDYPQERAEFFDEKQAITIEKLNFIDEVISQYESFPAKRSTAVALVQVPQKRDSKPPQEIIRSARNGRQEKVITTEKSNPALVNHETSPNVSTVSDKTGVLPRSILRTFRRIKQEIDPKSADAEEEVVKKFRKSRSKTAISIKFLLILIIVPLLTHQISKTFVISPIVDRIWVEENQQIIFLNRDYEEEAFTELHLYKENLEFKKIIGVLPDITPEEIEEKVREKAVEIADHYRYRGSDAIENVFADLCSLVAFGWVIYISKREILVLKSFLDEIIYGLSDSAKAFLIILFTDIFVGYHSPHGWEIILEGVSLHFGLPESREFNYLFIATFPVILDTVLKYWIFRYLNRISPSAVATYRNMNE